MIRHRISIIALCSYSCVAWATDCLPGASVPKIASDRICSLAESNGADRLLVAAEMAESSGADSEFVLELFVRSAKQGNLYSKIKSIGYIGALGKIRLSSTAKLWAEELANLGDPISQMELVSNCRSEFYSGCNEVSVGNWLLASSHSGYLPAIRMLVCDLVQVNNWKDAYPWVYIMNMNDYRAYCSGKEVGVADVVRHIDDDVARRTARQAAMFLHNSIRLFDGQDGANYRAVRLEAFRNVSFEVE